jgi:hypothetical protein
LGDETAFEAPSKVKHNLSAVEGPVTFIVSTWNLTTKELDLLTLADIVGSSGSKNDSLHQP